MRNAEVERRYDERDFAGLVELAERGPTDQRLAALAYLRALRRRHVVEPISERLCGDEDEHVRAAAARSLAALGGEAAERALLSADPATAPTRRAVAEALGILGSSAAAPKLIAMLKDGDAGVRRAAAEALGRVRAIASVGDLTRLLHDEDKWVRRRAREALIAIPTPASLAALQGKGRRRPLGWLDLRAARRSIARHERQARGEPSTALDRFGVRLGAGVLKAVIVAAVLVAVDGLLLGAPPLIVGVATLVGAIALGIVFILGADPELELDIGLARAEPRSDTMQVAPRWLTVARVLAWRPIGTSLSCAAPLAFDGIMGTTGVLPGLAAGLVLAIGVHRAFQGVGAWSCPDERAQRLLVDPDLESLQRARFFA